MIYRNNLKNREFGKEDPQNFRSERATIAERQGASENGNSEANPTRPKTDSSGCFGIKTILVFLGGVLIGLSPFALGYFRKATPMETSLAQILYVKLSEYEKEVNFNTILSVAKDFAAR